MSQDSIVKLQTMKPDELLAIHLDLKKRYGDYALLDMGVYSEETDTFSSLSLDNIVKVRQLVSAGGINI